MIVDVHAHIGAFAYGLRTGQTADRLIELMDKHGVDVSAISQLSTNMAVDNDAVSQAVKRYPDRLVGYAHIDPRDVDLALHEVDRCLRDLGLTGVKMHSNFDHFVPFDDDVLRVMDRISSYQVPVLFHTAEEYSRPLQIAYVAREFPKVPVILGHFGYIASLEVIPAAKLSDNVYLETSIHGEMPVYEEAIHRVGADRVLFGTDTPYGNHAVELKKIEVLNITAEDRKKILGENARKILRLKP
jgi:hypothetical protein